MSDCLSHSSGSATREETAAQAFFKLIDHKIWQWVAGILFDLLLEGEPVVLHQSVKSGLLRLVPDIGVLFEHWVC